VYLTLWCLLGWVGFFVCLFLEQDAFKLQVVMNRESVRNELEKMNRFDLEVVQTILRQ